MDPGRRPHSILNVLALPKSIIKKILCEYQFFVENGDKFIIVFFVDENREADAKESLVELENLRFAELSFAQDNRFKIEERVKTQMRDSGAAGEHRV